MDSLLCQNLPYDCFEVICLDDCSSDSSRKIILDYAKKYKNLRYVFNKINQKTATSLNNGLAHAKGIYIWIIGQDDWIEPNAAERVLMECEQSDLDVLTFNYNRVSHDEKEILSSVNVFTNVPSMNGEDYIRKYFYDTFCMYLLGYEWRAVFNRKFLEEHQIRFPDGCIYEDTTFMFKSMWKANKLGSLEDFLYNYRLNDYSITDVTKRYRADLVYEFAFIVGQEVLELANEMTDNHVSRQLIDQARKYFYSFTYKIVPASMHEKRVFYKLVSKDWQKIKPLSQYVNRYVWLMLNPKYGIYVTSLLKPVFLLKHMFKHKTYTNY